ncbi:MAG: hypothetical protein K2Y05_05385 [Hyphomicrobiaceae bacterium]|nr:hypothetical protein [Hyphomicrobiaceae bacterium]
MRHTILATVALAAVLAASPALADCKNEVLASLAKQRKVDAFRMDSTMVSEQGPLKMTVELAQPDKLRQVTALAISPDKKTETILIGGDAWSKDGDQWVKLSSDIAKELIAQRDDIMGDDEGTIGTVACLGSTAIEGRELMVYRIENDAQTGPKDMSPDAKAKAQKALTDEARPLRMFYVDPQSGLPVRSVFALANKIERPIFKADYSYSADIKIDAPK